MRLVRKYADNTKHDSVSNRFRKKRIALFMDLIKDLSKPVKILDVGGTQNFWDQMDLSNDSDLDITILNIDPEPNQRLKYVVGDARSLVQFADKEFDIVFSNSVIEHVGSTAEQKQMANEVMRVGKNYFVQTPNYYFPFEPHFLFPFFQFLPEALKLVLISRFSLGWYQKAQNRAEAEMILSTVKLLKSKELMKMFPHSRLLKEKFLFLTKSHIVTS